MADEVHAIRGGLSVVRARPRPSAVRRSLAPRSGRGGTLLIVVAVVLLALALLAVRYFPSIFAGYLHYPYAPYY